MLRMATWNVDFGRRLPVVLEGVSRFANLDLIAMQELSVHGGRDDAEAIAGRLGPAWRFAQVTAQTVSGKPQANGLAWNANRVELLDLSTVELPTPSGRVLRSLPATRRTAVVVDLRLSAVRARLYVVHLDVFGIAHKHAQFAHIMTDAARRPPVDLVIVAGDMNTYGVAGRPRWAELRRLAEAAEFEELTIGIGWTHRALGVRQKLDAIFASPRGLPHRVLRLLLPGSDHTPVMLELGEPGPP